MTPQQIKWASTHDWFVKGDQVKGSVTVMDLLDGEWETFTNFAELRAWAGY